MANNYVYTFKDNGFYKPLIEAAEVVEKKRFVDLYNKYHNTKYTEQELVGSLDQIGYDWKRMYVDILDGISPIQLPVDNEQLMNEVWDLVGNVLKDAFDHEMAAELALMQIEDGLSKSDKIKLERKARSERNFSKGFKHEADRAIHRFAQMKNLDVNTKIKETQSVGDSNKKVNWELYGDFAWKFPGSKVTHWSEVKTRLDQFHITGSGTPFFLAPLIQNSDIEQRGKTLVVIFDQKGIDETAKRLLKRKFWSTGAYPAYEDGDVTILSSEMLKYFQQDGIQLFHEPSPIQVEKGDVAQYNIETEEGLKSLVRTTFQKKQVHADLWYGKYN